MCRGLGCSRQPEGPTGLCSALDLLLDSGASPRLAPASDHRRTTGGPQHFIDLVLFSVMLLVVDTDRLISGKWTG